MGKTTQQSNTELQKLRMNVHRGLDAKIAAKETDLAKVLLTLKNFTGGRRMLLLSVELFGFQS